VRKRWQVFSSQSGFWPAVLMRRTPHVESLPMRVSPSGTRLSSKETSSAVASADAVITFPKAFCQRHTSAVGARLKRSVCSQARLTAAAIVPFRHFFACRERRPVDPLHVSSLSSSIAGGMLVKLPPLSVVELERSSN